MVTAADKETFGGTVAAADATAELVELGEAVVFGIHDDHEVGVGDVDADFDDGGRDENVDFVVGKILHDAIFFVRLHAAVKEGDFGLREDFGEFFRLFFDGNGFAGAAFFDFFANPVDLLVFGEVVADAGVEVVGEIDFFDDARGDGLAAGGQFV